MALEQQPTEEGLASPIEISCTHDMFTDYSKVQKMIEEIPKVISDSVLGEANAKKLNVQDSKQYAAEKAFEDMKYILDEYQSQPHLLDPHLESLLTSLLEFVKEAGAPSAATLNYRDTEAPCNLVAQQAFKYLYLLTKVRAYKSIVNKLPHEVRDLLPVLEMLEQPRDDKEDFHNTYILLLWLSIIVYMPFNIADFDATKIMQDENSKGDDSAENSVVGRLLKVIKQQLKSAQTSRDMAAFLASKLVTRPDLREKELPQFVTHCLQVLKSSTSSSHKHFREQLYHHLGCLRSLGLIWKHGRREELLPLSSNVLEQLQEYQNEPRDSMTTKLIMKLTQRIGLAFLPPRVASWRYKRGHRSLLMNMTLNAGGDNESANKDQPMEEDDDFDVDPLIEEVIDRLLTGLKDGDTIVRYSCSKGIGRVCGRLPRAMASEVVQVVLSSFTPRDTHFAWHGGCLTLAELGRRGLLLPEALPEVVKVLQKAFVYDKLMGQCSVGANIRDAACYLCWSLARAYDPDTLKPFVAVLAEGLLVVALFDREIPCRHAAAAAFQEHVGRQGNFPHGIEILTTVDYFSVGIRSSSYLTLSPFVASFSDYSKALVSHLVEYKLQHWDCVIRDLAAKTLQELSRFTPEYCTSVVLPSLLESARGQVLVARHGAILGLGHVIVGLTKVAENNKEDLGKYISQETLSSVFNLVGELGQRKLLQGIGGTYMRLALASMIHNIATAAIPVPATTSDEWLNLMEESIVFVEEDVKNASVQALSSLWSTYYSPTTIVKSVNTSCIEPISISTVQRYLSILSSERENHCHGMALALGGFPQPLLPLHGAAIVSGLISVCGITPEDATWAAMRRDAIGSILSLMQGMQKEGCLSQAQFDEVLKMLLRCLQDYTTDRRGDVGAWVREAAMSALQSIITSWPKDDPVQISKECCQKATENIIQLCAERIDRTRRTAGIALTAILHADSEVSPAVKFIAHRNELIEALPQSKCLSINWGNDEETFPLLGDILHYSEYRPRLTMGLAYSLGGVSACLANSSAEAFDSYLNSVDDSERGNFISTVLDTLEDQNLRERLALSLLKTLEHFLSASDYFDSVLESDEQLCQRLVSTFKRECHNCHGYHKLVSISTSLCEMLRLKTSLTKSILNQLLLFLGYQYPKVRTVTATSLYTALQECSDLLERKIIPSDFVQEVVMEILENTAWMDANLAMVREKRNQCCCLLGLPVPAARKKQQPSVAPTNSAK